MRKRGCKEREERRGTKRMKKKGCKEREREEERGRQGLRKEGLQGPLNCDRNFLGLCMNFIFYSEVARG